MIGLCLIGRSKGKERLHLFKILEELKAAAAMNAISGSIVQGKKMMINIVKNISSENRPKEMIRGRKE